MTHLTMARLGDIADVNWGDTSVTKASYVPTGFPAFSATGRDGFLPYADFDRDAIVLSAIGARCGKTWFTTGKWSCIKNTIRFWSTSPDVDNRYLYWATSEHSIWPKRGAAQPFITIGEARQLKIPLPRLPEQRRIAAILDQADALRAMRREALAQLESLTQSIFIEMFGDPASNSKCWSCQTLGELTEKITDGEHLNPVFSSTGMPIVMAGNVLEDSIDLSGAKSVEIPLGEKFRRKCNPERGDLLVVSRGATIGRMCAVDTDQVFCLMGSVILIKVKTDRLQTAFVSGLLKHPVMRSALYKTSGSSAQQAIYLKDLKNLPFIEPPLKLQQKYSERVAAIDALKIPHRHSLSELDFLFATLQYRAFRGEL